MIDKQKVKGIALIYLAAIILLLGTVTFINLNKNNSEITGFATAEGSVNETGTNETLAESVEVVNETAAVSEDTSTAENITINGTAEEIKTIKLKKPEPNTPPVWKSDIEEFIINGETAIDLNEYFSDSNNDAITYEATIPEKINIGINNNLITLKPAGNNFNTTIEFTASDGDKQTKKEVKLIVPERKIAINLEYGSNSIYDIDNNGVEAITGIVDLTVENTGFNWDVNEENLCTRWETYSVDSEESTTVCYGSSRCCQFVELLATRPVWNEPFYSSYGTYGAGFDNIISSQVLYVDYDLSADEPFAEVYYSDWKDLSTSYFHEFIDFRNVCVESCLLTGFNQSSYTLIFEIEDAVLELDTLTYTIVEEISQVLVNLGIKDNNGDESGTYRLFKDDAPVTIVDNSVEPDYYDIEIIPKENVIEKLLINNVGIIEPLTATIGIDNVSREQEIENVEIKKQYAIDASSLDFETGTLTAVASANSLFKCKRWDYDTEVCFGTWEKIKDLAAGEEYELTITADDPGFVEGNINITIAPTNITGLALIKNISNITIIKNDNATIDLSEYFLNIGNDTLFTYFEQENINILFENNIATIIPDKEFIGTRFTFITANQNGNAVVSNVFSITVTNITLNITPEIILKKKDFKLDEDVELDFEYLEKEDLVAEGKWKDEYEIYEEETEKTETELELLKEKAKEEEKLLSEEEKAVKKQKKKFVKQNETIEAFVYDYEGNLKDIDVDTEELREGKLKIKLNNQRAFKAGKYTLKLDLVKDGVAYTQEQDFTWGVLAINVNKSIYLENEDSFIGIGVLDDGGRIVCNADVTLEITDPLNQKIILTTQNNDIKISSECNYLGVTSLPDYYTTYTVSGVGNYLMNLTAITANGVRNIQDNFSVQSSVDFDVARIGPTRVYPAAVYTVKIPIIANKNYNGIINEYVPSGFAITPQDGLAVTTINDTNILSWNVNLNQNDKIELSYEFDAPDVSPEFYLLGPLDIGTFKEARQWQIANDQVSNLNVTYPNAGAPGMNLVVQFIGTGFVDTDTIVTNSSGNITIGPVIATDANGTKDSANRVVLSTVFYIHPNATAQDVQVNISGARVGNVFKIISLTGTNKNDGNFSGFSSGVQMIGNGRNGTRTNRGTIVLDALIIPSGVTVIVNTTDLDPNLKGDQGFFPVHIIVDGPVNISGILNVSGRRGVNGVATDIGGGGGAGGPGGGGGGGGGGDASTTNGGRATGGNGFTGGGGGSCESSTSCNMGSGGGNGTGDFGGRNESGGNSGGRGGNTTSPKVAGGQGGALDASGGSGGGGGTGFFFGSSGGSDGGAGGSGGGGGAASGTNGNDGGGGGFGTAGTAGSGGAGSANGNAQLVPLTGGSGGGGGGTSNTFGDGGGGGGGAVLIYATENITIMPTGAVVANGGGGGNSGANGGAGSGGAIVLQAKGVVIDGFLNTSNGIEGTAGGKGRIRVDGLDSPATTIYQGIAGSNFTGPAIKNITDTGIGGTANASADIIVYIMNQTMSNGVRGNKSIIGAADANGRFDIDVTWYNGRNYIAVIQNSTVSTYTVMSSAAVDVYDFVFVPVTPDATAPVINGTINNTAPRFGEVINATFNITDVGGALLQGNISINLTGNPVKNFTFVLSSTSAKMSQNITINVTRGYVLNITGFAKDATGNINQNSTLIIIANTPPQTPTVLLPANDMKFNSKPTALNVTFPADADRDAITINYYINGVLEASSSLNTTFTSSDGVYLLNVSIFDGEDTSTNATTINFTFDTVIPVTNATLNESFTNIKPNDVINLTANATDDRELSFGQIIVNDTGFKRYFNFSLSGAGAAKFSQNITVACNGGCVINFTARSNDTANNFRTNDTIITVADKTAPVVNTSLNKSLTNIFQGDVINITANVTDNIGLDICQFFFNGTSDGSKIILNKTVTGTIDQCSQNWTIDLAAGSVINFSVLVNDTSTYVAGGNKRLNDTIITVVSAATAPVVKLNNATFSVDPVAGGNAIILISFNVTDEQGADTINASKAIVNLTLGTPDIAQFRFNISDQGGEFGTCGNYTDTAPTPDVVVINCTILMRYYDNSSNAWVINVSVQDTSGLVGRNDTVTFTYNALSAFSITAKDAPEAANLNFSGVFVGTNDQTAKAPLLLNNTGNDDFDQINITGADLLQVGGAGSIAITNFYVNVTNNTNGFGLQLSTSPLTIPATTCIGGGCGVNPNATLMHGPSSEGTNPYPGVADSNTKGNQTLIFFVDIPSGLAAATYNNTWNMTVVDIG